MPPGAASTIDDEPVPAVFESSPLEHPAFRPRIAPANRSAAAQSTRDLENLMTTSRERAYLRTEPPFTILLYAQPSTHLDRSPPRRGGKAPTDGAGRGAQGNLRNTATGCFSADGM